MKPAAVVVAGIAIGISASGLMSQAQSVGNRSDEDMVRNVIVMMTEDFNRHDAKAATQMYAPDARFVTVRGEVMGGQPTIEKGMTSIFGTPAEERFPSDGRCRRQVHSSGYRLGPCEE